MGATSPTLGAIWQTHSLTIERINIPAGTQLWGHGHDCAHLCFLERGGFRERHAGRDMAMDSGMLRSSPPGDEHNIIFQSSSSCFLILLTGDHVAREPGKTHERKFVTSSFIEGLARRLSHNLTSELIVSPLRLEAAVLELVAATSVKNQRRGKVPPTWLTRIREQIQDDPSKMPSTTALASESGYHPVYVARAFRQFYGIGIGEYGRLIRAEKACELLAVQEESLAQIALRAGYADQSHLTRSLRNFTGFTPSEIRKQKGQMIQVASIQDLE